MERFITLFRATVMPHAAQRYPTTGDWCVTATGPIEVAVSNMGDEDMHFLVAIHELIEAKLCARYNIFDDAVTAFDVAYEDARPTTGTAKAPCGCDVTPESEPGDDPHAPYYSQHQIATSVERLLACELGVPWPNYEAANLALYETKGPGP